MATTFTARSRALALALALAATLVSTLTACGGGSDAAPAAAPLAAGTFTRTFAPSALGGSWLPFGGGPLDFRAQFLYTADELGGAGLVSALRFQRASALADAVTCPGTSIRLGHTSRAVMGTSLAANVDASTITTVLGSATVTVPPGAAEEWFEVPLATPFDYDGVLNLVLEVENTAPCSASASYRTDWTRPAMRCLSSGVDTDPTTPQHSTTTCTPGDHRPRLKLVFSGGETLAVAGEPSASTYYAYPFSAAPVRTQHLLLAADIDGSGPVTGVAFETVTPVPGGAAFDFTVRIGHTTLSALGTSFEANFATSAIATVAERVTFTVPAATPVNRFFWIPLTGPFAYNGRDNLVVDVQAHAPALGAFGVRIVPRTASRLHAFGLAPATGALSDAALRMKLRFRGAPVTLATAPLNPSTVGLGAFTVAAGVLYDSTLFGTGGRIEALGLRLAAPTTVATAPRLEIRMGTTTRTALSTADTYASNLDGETVVFDGPFPIPAGLQAGDWVRIPLRTPFTWTPEKNLSLLLSAVGVGGAPPTWKAVGPEYGGHTVYESGTLPASTAAIPPLVEHQVLDLKLHLGR